MNNVFEIFENWLFNGENSCAYMFEINNKSEVIWM